MPQDYYAAARVVLKEVQGLEAVKARMASVLHYEVLDVPAQNRRLIHSIGSRLDALADRLRAIEARVGELEPSPSRKGKRR